MNQQARRNPGPTLTGPDIKARPSRARYDKVKHVLDLKWRRRAPQTERMMREIVDELWDAFGGTALDLVRRLAAPARRQGVPAGTRAPRARRGRGAGRGPSRRGLRQRRAAPGRRRHRGRRCSTRTAAPGPCSRRSLPPRSTTWTRAGSSACSRPSRRSSGRSTGRSHREKAIAFGKRGLRGRGRYGHFLTALPLLLAAFSRLPAVQVGSAFARGRPDAEAYASEDKGSRPALAKPRMTCRGRWVPMAAAALRPKREEAHDVLRDLEHARRSGPPEMERAVARGLQRTPGDRG